MATFCSEECENTGGCCDYCTHYLDDSVALNKKVFSGVGFCSAKGKRVDACGGCNDDFYCTLYVQPSAE